MGCGGEVGAMTRRRDDEVAVTRQRGDEVEATR
jgi:hypothetical protein